jgi:hypothetical protein
LSNANQANVNLGICFSSFDDNKRVAKEKLQRRENKFSGIDGNDFFLDSEQ